MGSEAETAADLERLIYDHCRREGPRPELRLLVVRWGDVSALDLRLAVERLLKAAQAGGQGWPLPTR